MKFQGFDSLSGPGIPVIIYHFRSEIATIQLFAGCFCKAKSVKSRSCWI